MKIHRHFRVAFAAFALGLTAGLLGGCDPATPETAPVAAEIDAQSVCELDGMLLADYPGPKAQIRYADQDGPAFFCDTVELLNTLLAPEQVRKVDAAWVQDMGQADWERPRGHWIDARSAFYVLGSKRHGSMGPTIASFAAQADAAKFAGEYGGRVLPFAEIDAEMVDLSGGALHDQHM